MQINLGNKRPSIKRTSFTITPLGSEKLEKSHLSGIDVAILTELQESGASTISEIANSRRLDTYRTENAVRILTAKGLVNPIIGREV